MALTTYELIEMEKSDSCHMLVRVYTRISALFTFIAYLHFKIVLMENYRNSG